MALLRPDPTFYPSPRLAMQAPPERLAYVAALNPPGGTLKRRDARDRCRPRVSQLWQARGANRSAQCRRRIASLWLERLQFCALSLCPASAYRATLLGCAGHPLFANLHPGYQARSSEPLDRENHRTTGTLRTHGYSRPHTVHCGPEGDISALGAPDGNGPAGIFLLDHFTFEVLGKWEMDRGSQYLGYDFWWHITQDTLLTSEWGTPNQVENGVIPEELLQGRYGHQVHVWDLRKRRHVQALTSARSTRWFSKCAPRTTPKTYGFSGVVVSLKDLSASIWLWHRQDGAWQIEKVIEIPAEPADPEKLPRCLRASKQCRLSSPILISP